VLYNQAKLTPYSGICHYMKEQAFDLFTWKQT
jgi:hypothetical protein